MKPRLRLINLTVAVVMLFGVVGFSPELANAETRAISTGDIAIILANMDNPDALAFVALADIPAGEEILFTDSGWYSAGGFRGNEGGIKWTAPTGGISAGTIVYRDNPFDSEEWSIANDANVGNYGFSLSTSGDQVLAFQGDSSSPAFIYALNDEGAGIWQADATSSNTSALPTGLTNGTDAVAVAEADNIKLNCAENHSGTKAELLAYISNKANWVGNSSTRQSIDPSCSFTVSGGGTDDAPYVSSTTPTDAAFAVAVNANIDITFSEAVTAGTGWYDILCDQSGAHTAAVTDNDPTFTLNPDTDFALGDVCTVSIEADFVTDDDTDDPPDNMLADYSFDFYVAACGATYTKINEIQGSGLTSPLDGSEVTVEAVVSAVFPDLGGVFLQSLPADDDADATTSEGIFVYGISASPGDQLHLIGTVAEYAGSYGAMAGMTQLSSVKNVETCTTTSTPTPTQIVLPLPSGANPDDYLERYEGMYVYFNQTLTVQQNYFQGRFGQVTLGSDGRIFTPTNGMGGDYTANIRRMIILDDGNSAQNPDPISYYASDGALRAGDTLPYLEGILDQGRINSARSYTPADWVFPDVYYRIHPVAAPVFSQANPRPSAPANQAQLKLASFNVLNYFTTLDQTPYPSESPYDSGTRPRGADSTTEFTRQEDKLIAAFYDLDADIIGLVEIESWDGANAVGAFTTALNNSFGAGTYNYIADPATGTGGDVIQQAIVYKPGSVTPIGSALSTNASPFDSYRYPIAQLFEDNTSGERFWVIVNHFKSKNCSGSPTGGDLDPGGGVGCYNATRVAMSNALLTWINNTLVPIDPDVIITGDLNSYGGEDPITTLTSAGMIDQVADKVEEAERYTYVYDGMAGYLEHAVTSASMQDKVYDITFWHINIDEPSVIDYNTEYKSVDLYQAHPYRSSDHDPIVIYLSFNTYYFPIIFK